MYKNFLIFLLYRTTKYSHVSVVTHIMGYCDHCSLSVYVQHLLIIWQPDSWSLLETSVYQIKAINSLLLVHLIPQKIRSWGHRNIVHVCYLILRLKLYPVLFWHWCTPSRPTHSIYTLMFIENNLRLYVNKKIPIPTTKGIDCLLLLLWKHLWPRIWNLNC